ncbi:MAG: HAMP domain-containing histidine kinase [Thermomicrobiales bacterium]|nr:HAMP domain-containing histidine kinase [Thermomicrobiales bacterium]
MPTETAGSSDSDVYYQAVAQFVYNADGELVVDEPCGFTDDPKPPPEMPEIPSAEVELLVNRIVTTPAVDGSLDYRMLVQQTAGGETVVTASPLDSVDAAIDQLVRTLIVVGLVALLAATAASWWLIRRGMRPVDRMVDTATAIAGGNLSLRVTDADPRTELGRLGGALNEMLGQIETAIDARAASETRLRRFVADAAHELRTPLTSLRGYAELYRAGALADDASVTNAMGRIEAEGARMSRLVDDLLLLARLDQQRGLETKPVDLVALANEAVADFRAVDPDRPLTASLSGTAVVQGDRTRLRQVFDNLLTNARVHTPPGTPVHVGVATIEGAVEITVSDQGAGIAPEDQERIFERFRRADPARARKTGGSGLGLAIVASLVDAHGGAVSVESSLGKGTTFTVRIPKNEPSSQPETAR